MRFTYFREMRRYASAGHPVYPARFDFEGREIIKHIKFCCRILQCHISGWREIYRCLQNVSSVKKLAALYLGIQLVGSCSLADYNGLFRLSISSWSSLKIITFVFIAFKSISFHFYLFIFLHVNVKDVLHVKRLIDSSSSIIIRYIIRRLQDWRCLWCRATVHTACRPAIGNKCPLGPAKLSVVPPTALHSIGNHGA